MDLQAFRNDKGTEYYYKSSFDIKREEGEIEWLVDNLSDAISWSDMKKGEEKHVGSLYAFCADRIINLIDDSNEFEGEILIMLTYDAYPDDTIKLRFKIDGEIEDDGSIDCWGQEIYYLDSEEQENPLDYSGFQELYAAVEEAARL